MELLVLVLNKKEHVRTVLKALLRLGVSGATVFPSTGMGRTLADEVPLFGGLRRALDGETVDNTTIFSVIEDESVVANVIQSMPDLVGDLRKPGTGILFTVPVTRVIGTRQPATVQGAKRP
ncbi:MAG: P-II family nitrogen regulator [Ignavibacteriales bacterium]